MNRTTPEILCKPDLKLCLIFGLMLSLLPLAGCGGSGSSTTHHHRRPTPTPSATPTPTPPAGIAGFIFGGSPTGGSPISGSEVTLYQAGATGYGAGAVQLMQVTSSSDGGFDFPSVTCQTTGDSQQIYLAAAGGTVKGQSGANSAIALSAGVGSCANYAHSVVVNEVTTVATVWTLDQFMDPSGQNIGTASTNPSGLSNAATAMTSNSLVDLSTGLAPDSFPPGVNSPTDTLYSLANILSGCVDSSGADSTGCQSLFSAATPPGGVAPTTTIQAALNIARNPANNVTALFALVPASPPFMPGLTSAPAGWVLTVQYAPSAAGLNSPYAIVLDSAGNVWVANASGDTVSELIGAAGYTAALNFGPAGANLNFPSWLAFDTAGNLWVTNLQSNSVSELTAASGYATGFNFAPAAADFSAPISLAFDATGNLWVANYGNDSVAELLAGCSSGSCTATNFGNANTGSPGAVFIFPTSLAADAAGNLWVTNYLGDSVSELLAGCSSASCTGNNFGNSNTGTPGAGFAGPLEVEPDSAGNIWVVNRNGNSVSELPAGCAPASCTAANFDNSNTGTPGAAFNTPIALAIDAGNNIWIPNDTDSSVSELTAASSYAAAFNFGPWPTYLGQFSAAADAGGNLWIANNNPDSVSEMLGVTTPTLAPLSACLARGHNLCLP
ncbi:MAG: NHL repeat-containing protein [Candidatus Binataceae bacterium]